MKIAILSLLAACYPFRDGNLTSDGGAIGVQNPDGSSYEYCGYAEETFYFCNPGWHCCVSQDGGPAGGCCWPQTTCNVATDPTTCD